MPLQAPHWMSPQQARFFLALPDADARMQYIDQLRSMRLRNPRSPAALVQSELLPQLYQAASRPLKGWLDSHTKAVDALVRKSQALSAGRSLGKRDVGEKIGGARKDMAEIRRLNQLAALESLGAAVAYKAVTKASVLGEFDVHAAKAAGDSAGCAFLKSELWKSVQTRPDDSPRARMRFVEGCALLREGAAPCHTADALYAFLSQWSWRAMRGEEVAERMDKATFDARFGPISEAYRAVQRAGFASYRSDGDGYAVFKPMPYDEKTRQTEIVDALGPRMYGAIHRQTKARRGLNRTTPAFHEDIRSRGYAYERADDWSWSTEGEVPDGQPKTRNEFVFVRAGLTGARSGGIKLPPISGDYLRTFFHLRGVEHGNWMGDTDADTGEHAAFGAFTDLVSVTGLPPAAMGFQGRLGLALGARGGGKASAHYEPSRRVINLTKTRGAGTLAHEWGHALDHWLADPTGAAGKALFCSHGVRCGIPAVDAAFRAVMVAIVGSSNRIRNPAVSLEPLVDESDWSRRSVAMTEWQVDIRRRKTQAINAHDEAAVDALTLESDQWELTRQKLNKLRNKWIAAQREGKTKAPPKGTTNYVRSAMLLGEYWARPEELFARAWEATIEDMLTERRMISGYLVSGTQTAYSILRDDGHGNAVPCEVYPQGAERAAIGAAMQSLIRAIRESWT